MDKVSHNESDGDEIYEQRRRRTSSKESIAILLDIGKWENPLARNLAMDQRGPVKRPIGIGGNLTCDQLVFFRAF